MKVYWNSTRRIWSVVENGKVTAHKSYVDLKDCVFKVSQAGRQRVIREGRKNVHAYVAGNKNHLYSIGDMLDWVQVVYNPYLLETFVRVDTNAPVYEARRVFMNAQGQVFADLP